MTEALTTNFTRLIEALKSQSAAPDNTLTVQLTDILTAQVVDTVNTPPAANIGPTLDDFVAQQNSNWQDDQYSSFFNPFNSISPCTSQAKKLSIQNRDFLTNQRIEELRNQSSSGNTFAVKMLEDIFDKQQLVSSNISGRGSNKTIVKNKLDNEKIKYIEKIADKHYNHSKSNEFAKSIRNAITRHVNKLSVDYHHE